MATSSLVLERPHLWAVLPGANYEPNEKQHTLLIPQVSSLSCTYE